VESKEFPFNTNKDIHSNTEAFFRQVLRAEREMGFGLASGAKKGWKVVSAYEIFLNRFIDPPQIHKNNPVEPQADIPHIGAVFSDPNDFSAHDQRRFTVRQFDFETDAVIEKQLFSGGDHRAGGGEIAQPDEFTEVLPRILELYGKPRR